MLYNLKVQGSGNQGDKLCSPFDYFEAPEEVIPINICHALPDFTKKDMVVIGGGGLIDYSAKWNRRIEKVFEQAGSVFIWGAGYNRHYDTLDHPSLDLWKHQYNPNHFIGLRDYTSSFQWVPCVTCMNSKFDRRRRDNVTGTSFLYLRHPDRPKQDYSNQISNLDSFDSIVEAIRKHENIISETYHGAYWSLLLNKHVILLSPFSTRFDGFPFPLIRIEVLRRLPDVGFQRKFRSPYQILRRFITEARKLNNHAYTRFLRIYERISS